MRKRRRGNLLSGTVHVCSGWLLWRCWWPLLVYTHHAVHGTCVALLACGGVARICEFGFFDTTLMSALSGELQQQLLLLLLSVSLSVHLKTDASCERATLSQEMIT